MFRKDFVALALLLSAPQVSADPLIATQYGDFDRYVLALSWQTGFCQSMQDRNRSEPEECRLQQEPDNKADFLTVHGLWPGRDPAAIHVLSVMNTPSTGFVLVSILTVISAPWCA